MSEGSRRDVIIARLRALDPRQRALAIVLVVLVVLTIAAVLLSGGGGEPLGAPSGPVLVRSPTPTPTVTTPPVTSAGFEGKDPFQPLVETQPTQAPTPGTSPMPTGSVAGPTGGSQTGSAPTVTLLDIFSQRGKLYATVDVNGTQYTVTKGQTFAQNFRVVSLSKSCGTFLFGDERFTLCIGQEVRK